MTQIVSLSFFRFDRFPARVWAFAMMGLARGAMARTPGIGFWKLCGSGVGEGFTPIPNTAVYAILATWPDLPTAQRQTTEAPIFVRYRAQASECWTVYLRTQISRGEWSGVAPFEVVTNSTDGPIAALTRATLKPRVALQFWRRAPDISRAIGANRHVMFKIGIGEVPWLQQVTFSIWPNGASMNAFARRDGPHARAVRAVREGAWFREELYARFAVAGDHGSWGGVSPLARQEISP